MDHVVHIATLGHFDWTAKTSSAFSYAPVDQNKTQASGVSVEGPV